MSFENFFGEAEFNYEAEKQKFIDNMDFLKGSTNITHTGILLRDAIINYIVTLNDQNIKISAELDGRINHAE